MFGAKKGQKKAAPPVVAAAEQAPAAAGGVASLPLPQAVLAQPPVPRYTTHGILLNPENFNIGADGVLMPKAS